MNAKELKRLPLLTHKGCSGHLTVWRGDRRTVMPMHGSRKELGAGLVNKILKDLEIMR